MFLMNQSNAKYVPFSIRLTWNKYMQTKYKINDHVQNELEKHSL